MDKKIPVGVIIALMFHGGGIIWWASGVTKDMVAFDMRLKTVEGSTATAGDQQTKLLVSLTKLEGKMDALGESSKRIELAMDKKADKK